MKSIRRFLVTILILALSAGFPLQAQSERQFTSTLLPVKTSASPLWIQNHPKHEIFLQFDLSGLPPGLKEADFKRCALRLVAKEVVYRAPNNPNTGGQPGLVKGQLANDDFSDNQTTGAIIALSALSDKNIIAMNRQATEMFRQAVWNRYSGGKKISLRLFSESHKASTLFYSSENTGENPSNLPRLVIEYSLGPPALLETLSWSQRQQNPEHTGRNPWIPFRNPKGLRP